MLKINDKMPDFEILTDQGEFKISNYIGKKIIVFFFPKADTSGCTAESIGFTSLQKEFDKLNCIVIGISKTPGTSITFKFELFGINLFELDNNPLDISL